MRVVHPITSSLRPHRVGTKVDVSPLANELQGYRVMKSRDAALRAKRFEVAEKARKADDLLSMIRDFEIMAADLERQIMGEEERTGVKDATHFSYSTFAKAATLRRDKLLVSVADLKSQLEVAVAAHDVAKESLAALEADEIRDGARHHNKIERNGVAYG